MTFFVVGVDPGKSSAVAALDDRGRLVAVWQGPGTQVYDQLDRLLTQLVDVYHADVDVGCERYVERSQRGQVRTHQSDAQRVYGVVESVCTYHHCRLTPQAPAAVKTFAPNALLRRLGLYVSASDRGWADADDANDAVRHAVAVLGRYHATVLDHMLAGVDL